MILTTVLHPNGIIFVEEATYMIALDALKQFTGMKIVTGESFLKEEKIME